MQRRLSWRPQPIVPIAAPVEAPKAAPVMAPPASTKASAPPAKHAKAAAPSPEWDPAALLARFPQMTDRPYAEVDGDEARWLWLHGACFLDARRTDVYAEGHIAGAALLPVWEDGLPAKIAALLHDKADPALPTVVYCAGGDCEDSRLLAQKLWMAGFRNLRVYSGGFPEWASRGWPVAKGAAP
jgi:rhodanese-related sulfurtransferase